MFDFTSLFLQLQLQLKIGNISPSCRIGEQAGQVSLPLARVSTVRHGLDTWATRLHKSSPLIISNDNMSLPPSPAIPRHQTETERGHWGWGSVCVITISRASSGASPQRTVTHPPTGGRVATDPSLGSPAAGSARVPVHSRTGDTGLCTSR